ncbi:DegT/DnrJ/EryC1/StrS family aminotransferase [Desulforamulus aeronauticus]|uniref:dTDP-4-amino-4,6-dideoxygalactose transaminase n=1 Tax=Desulforamulus aeronauticus DSM 10349 TaxID=1121421 RepID=A0A1M6VK09_9FIRM|nr:DegT/DnrJ/EryC1/StrS family aminotransferase [Desulforamulus aeronauticus]SHK81897.1 dTDP-4-amino-4,6-dideoxygalactose transaminase [Desulforamulus aeronauticus DSM 10349]
MNKKISFAGPSITAKEVSYVMDAVNHGWYENYDQYIKRLEKACADYVGVKYAVATHCCTLALHLAAQALGLKPGDEVIVTDFSWVATAYAIAYTGATCVFVDIDPDTWTIDPHCIRQAITTKTKAIMLVHTFGHPAEMDEILKIAAEYGLFVIEDAAPAIGATYKGKPVGSFGDVACFSFQGAKMTVSGEGGMLLTNNEEIYQKASLLASMGRTDRKAVFWSDLLGYQYTINNVTAALALAQLERVDELLAKKRQLFTYYDQRLKDVAGIKIIKEKPGCQSNYCYPSLLLDSRITANRDDILAGLKQLNIHARPGFPRMSCFPVFEQRFENPVAKNVEQRGISLPSAANLDEADIEFVCQSLLSLIHKNTGG